MDKVTRFPEQPNREYVRSFQKKYKLQNESTEDVRKIIDMAKAKERLETLKAIKETFKFFNEGDKVKLNLESIKADVNYTRKNEKWKKFVDENADRVFTIEYDTKHQEKPVMVCLKEDTTDPKWLWWEGDLKLIKPEAEAEESE